MNASLGDTSVSAGSKQPQFRRFCPPPSTRPALMCRLCTAPRQGNALSVLTGVRADCMPPQPERPWKRRLSTVRQPCHIMGHPYKRTAPCQPEPRGVREASSTSNILPVVSRRSGGPPQATGGLVKIAIGLTRRQGALLRLSLGTSKRECLAEAGPCAIEAVCLLCIGSTRHCHKHTTVWVDLQLFSRLRMPGGTVSARKVSVR